MRNGSIPNTSRAAEALTAEGFFKTVLRSGLLGREQLLDSLRTLPPGERGNPETVANHLVRAGKLSRFQARKLLQGTATGLVLGPFQVLAPIGKGGTGTVYLARDNRTENQLVALKVLPPKKARQEERLLARFRREMDLCQRVSHPNLAWTYEVGVYQGIYYIAMEYVPGKSLYRLVAEEGRLSVPRAARLFAEVASAIDHAHQQGLIHRDLKPSNIHITPHDHAVVLDLGLALIEGEAVSNREVMGGQGYIVGTMDYIAPEQTADACCIDIRADVYALGGTLYYALTGRPPFPGGTAKEKINRHRTQEPAPVHSVNPGVPEKFSAIVHTMLAKAPDHRYPSMAVVREQLLKWAEDGPALPMDQPSDKEYAEAVASLRVADPSSDLDVPITEPSSSIRASASEDTQRTEWTAPPLHRAPLSPDEPGPLALILLLGVGALLLGSVTLAAMLHLWLGP